MVPNESFDFSMMPPNFLFRSFLLVILSIVGAIILSVLFGKSILNSKAFKRLVLADEQASSQGYVSSTFDNEVLGKEGLQEPVWGHSGKVRLDGNWLVGEGWGVDIEKME